MAKVGGLIFLACFGLFWCTLVFAFDMGVAWNTARQLLVYRYGEADGVVTRSEVQVKNSDDGVSYEPQISYRYEVDGRQLEAHQARYDYFSLGSERAHELVRDYPVGQTVTVYYNPAAPADAVLERGLDMTGGFAFLFLAPFNAVAFAFIGGFAAWFRSLRLGRPVVGVAVRDDGLATHIRIYDYSPSFIALAGWGGSGFLSMFAVLGAWWFMPLEFALALGVSATIAGTIVAWRSARSKYIEIRRDRMLGNVTLRERDGVEFLLQPGDLRPGRYNHRREKDSEGDLTDKFTVYLPFHDREGDQPRTLKVTEQSTKDEAVKYLAWLNGVLDLDAGGK